MESFYQYLKTEHVYFKTYKTRNQAKSTIFEYIEAFYNRKRSHTALGFVSPECYEQQLLAKCGRKSAIQKSKKPLTTLEMLL